MTIRALLLDIGGVLWRIKDLSQIRAWETRLGLSQGQLARIAYSNPVSARATVGEATTDEVWEEVARQLQLSPQQLQEIKAIFSWDEAGTWDTALLETVRSLRPRFKTGIISNAWPGARESMQHTVNSDLFDVIVYSGEEGVCKPDPEIYYRALSRLGVRPQEVIFCDDRLENVDGARAVGMRAFQFTSSAQARQEIARLLEG